MPFSSVGGRGPLTRGPLLPWVGRRHRLAQKCPPPFRWQPGGPRTSLNCSIGVERDTFNCSGYRCVVRRPPPGSEDFHFFQNADCDVSQFHKNQTFFFLIFSSFFSSSVENLNGLLKGSQGVARRSQKSQVPSPPPQGCQAPLTSFNVGEGNK